MSHFRPTMSHFRLFPTPQNHRMWDTGFDEPTTD